MKLIHPAIAVLAGANYIRASSYNICPDDLTTLIENSSSNKVKPGHINKCFEDEKKYPDEKTFMKCVGKGGMDMKKKGLVKKFKNCFEMVRGRNLVEEVDVGQGDLQPGYDSMNNELQLPMQLQLPFDFDFSDLMELVSQYPNCLNKMNFQNYMNTGFDCLFKNDDKVKCFTDMVTEIVLHSGQVQNCFDELHGDLYFNDAEVSEVITDENGFLGTNYISS